MSKSAAARHLSDAVSGSQEAQVPRFRAFVDQTAATIFSNMLYVDATHQGQLEQIRGHLVARRTALGAQRDTLDTEITRLTDENARITAGLATKISSYETAARGFNAHPAARFGTVVRVPDPYVAGALFPDLANSNLRGNGTQKGEVRADYDRASTQFDALETDHSTMASNNASRSTKVSERATIDTILSTGGSLESRIANIESIVDACAGFGPDGDTCSGELALGGSYDASDDLLNAGHAGAGVPRFVFHNTDGAPLPTHMIGGHACYPVSVNPGQGANVTRFVRTADLVLDPTTGAVTFDPGARLYNRMGAVWDPPQGSYTFVVHPAVVIPTGTGVDITRSKALTVSSSANLPGGTRDAAIDALNAMGHEVEEGLLHARERDINTGAADLSADIQRVAVRSLVDRMHHFANLDDTGKTAFMSQLHHLPAPLNFNSGNELWLLDQPPAPGTNPNFVSPAFPHTLYNELKRFVLDELQDQSFAPDAAGEIEFQHAVMDIVQSQERMQAFLQARVEAVLREPNHRILLRQATQGFAEQYTQDDGAFVQQLRTNLGGAAHRSYRGGVNDATYGLFFAGREAQGLECRIGDQAYQVQVDPSLSNAIRMTVTMGDQRIVFQGEDHAALCQDILSNPELTSESVRPAKLKTHMMFSLIKCLLRTSVDHIPGKMVFANRAGTSPDQMIVRFDAAGELSLVRRIYDPVSGNRDVERVFEEGNFNESHDFRYLVDQTTDLSLHFARCANTSKRNLDAALSSDAMVKHHIEGTGLRAVLSWSGFGRKLMVNRKFVIGDYTFRYNLQHGKHFLSVDEEINEAGTTLWKPRFKNLQEAIENAGAMHYASRILDEVHHGIIGALLEEQQKIDDPRPVRAQHPHTRDRYILQPDGNWGLVRATSPHWASLGSGRHGIVQGRVRGMELLGSDASSASEAGSPHIAEIYGEMAVVGGIAREMRRQI